jgi:Tfp pilus assembly protein PilV
MTYAFSHLSRRRQRGFMLLEAMLAVTIFALGVITLGRCVNQCVSAERLKQEDELARRLLENRWAEIESGVGALPTDAVEEFDETSPFHLLKIHVVSTPLELTNENDEIVDGIYNVTLTVTWMSDGDEQSKELSFYYYPRNTNASAAPAPAPGTGPTPAPTPTTP